MEVPIYFDDNDLTDRIWFGVYFKFAFNSHNNGLG